MSYKIFRHYQRTMTKRVVQRGLSLEEAQAHCKSPEASSRTATKPNLVKITREKGPWFDGYAKE